MQNIPKILLFLLITPPLLIHSLSAQGFNQKDLEKKIRKKVEDEFKKLPTLQTSALGITITYKKIPSDYINLALNIAKSLGLPLNRQQLQVLAKQYSSKIESAVAKHTGKIGTLETTVKIKLGRKTVSPGKYHLGVSVRKFRIYQLVLYTEKTLKNGRKKKKFAGKITFRKSFPLKTSQGVPLELHIITKEKLKKMPKKTQRKFRLRLKKNQFALQANYGKRTYLSRAYTTYPKKNN
ncbi:MAG: hypothetical protein D6805_06355 [Planctomycetota bacterium]|nr:MAG: hypothetical protein D6805_06355 [Planctomycetota bacterium]